MRRILALGISTVLLLGFALFAQRQVQFRHVHLPTSKSLSGPIPGRIGSLNGFTPTIAVSPDKRYAALLNDGHGTQKSKGFQSITVLDLSTNTLTEFPDERLGEDARQSYFIGLAFSSDGQHLYASMGSITDPTGERPGDTGNGIAVYRFRDGKVAPERFIQIAPQKIADGKKVASALRKTAPGTAIPYPAGLAVIAKDGKPDELLVANNYSDNALLIDSASGRVLQEFDLSTNALIPSSFPYACVANRDGGCAWCSLWNASRLAQLDLKQGKIARWIPLMQPEDPLAPGSHPTAMVLSPDEKLLYVRPCQRGPRGSGAGGRRYPNVLADHSSSRPEIRRELP